VPLCRLALWLDPRYHAAVPCDDVELRELRREVRACIFFALALRHCKPSTNTVTHVLKNPIGHNVPLPWHAHHEGPRLQ
jgi:hypothetical protein